MLGGLAERFAVFAPDRPGCGLTEPFSYRGVDLRRHAVDFIRSTLDALGLQRVALVGNSMGGYWSMAFALAHPERVSRLVLVGEPAGSAARAPLGYRFIGTRGVNQLLYATKLRPTPASVRESYASRLVANIDRVPPSYLAMALAAARQPGAQHAWLTMVERGTRWFASSPLTYALRAELPRLTTPTLFLWGDRDSFGPALLAQQMADLMPSAAVVTLPDAGHLVWLDQPERTLALVTGFLSEASPEPTPATPHLRSPGIAGA
jgi:pimeloyl-ACP methyl ester carboxylesterase